MSVQRSRRPWGRAGTGGQWERQGGGLSPLPRGRPLVPAHLSHLPRWKALGTRMEHQIQTDHLEKYLLWLQNMSQAILAEYFPKSVAWDQKCKICREGHYCENSQVCF